MFKKILFNIQKWFSKILQIKSSILKNDLMKKIARRKNGSG